MPQRARSPDELRAYARRSRVVASGRTTACLPLAIDHADRRAAGRDRVVTRATDRAPRLWLRGGDGRPMAGMDRRARGRARRADLRELHRVHDRLDRSAASARWPEGFVPAGRCALANALAGYFGCLRAPARGRRRAGSPANALAEVLAGLGAGAIQIANEGPLFAPGRTGRSMCDLRPVVGPFRANGLGRACRCCSVDRSLTRVRLARLSHPLSRVLAMVVFSNQRLGSERRAPRLG